MSKLVDDVVDLVLEIVLFPFYGASIYLPIAGIGALIGTQFREGVLYLLSALVCFSVARGIGKYFDYKKDTAR